MKNPVAEFHKVITQSASTVQTRSEKRDQRLKQASSTVILHLNGAKELYCKLTLLKRYFSSLVGAVCLPASLIIHLLGNVEEKRGNLFRSEFLLLKHSTINKLYIFLLAQLESFGFQRFSIENVLMERQTSS